MKNYRQTTGVRARRRALLRCKKEEGPEISARDRAFLTACRKLGSTERGRKMSARELAHTAAKNPAPGYFITYDYALRILRGTEANERRGSEARRRNEEIRLRVSRVAARRKLHAADALTHVLEGGASSFFMSPKRAERIYYQSIQKTKEEGGQTK